MMARKSNLRRTDKYNEICLPFVCLTNQSGRRVHILAGRCSPIMSMCFLEGSLEPAIGIRDKNEELRKERSSTVQNAFCESRQDKKCYRDRLVLFLPLVRVQKRKLLAFLAFVPNLCRPVTKKSGKIQAKRKVHHTNYSAHNPYASSSGICKIFHQSKAVGARARSS